MLAFASGCTSGSIGNEPQQQSRYSERTVKVNGVKYHQVYYIDKGSKQVIIVNQTEVKNKPKQNNGKKKGHYKD